MMKWITFLLLLSIGVGGGVFVSSSLYDDQYTKASLPSSVEIRQIIEEELSKQGVSKDSIAYGVYPVISPSFEDGLKVPLLSFTCPEGITCHHLIMNVQSAIKKSGFSLVASKDRWRPGNPLYKMVEINKLPVIALRLLPAGPRLSLLLSISEALGQSAALYKLLPSKIAIATPSKSNFVQHQLNTDVTYLREIYYLAKNSSQIKKWIAEKSTIANYAGPYISSDLAKDLDHQHLSKVGEYLATTQLIWAYEQNLRSNVISAIAIAHSVRRLPHYNPQWNVTKLEDVLRGIEAKIGLEGEVNILLNISNLQEVQVVVRWVRLLQKKGVLLFAPSELAL